MQVNLHSLDDPPLLFGKPVSAPKMNASAMHALHTVPGLGMEPQAHEEIVDPRDRTYSHQGWKIASWIPSLLLPTHPRVFSLPKVSPNLSEIRSQLRLRATFFISTPEFLRRCSWFTTIITDEKDRSRGPGRTRLSDN